MQSNTHRITIEAFLIPTLNRTAGPENDPACAAFVFGILRFAWRYAGALRIGNLAIVRKGLTMEVRGEPPADFLAELQRLGDEFEVATTAKGQAPGDFEPRVTVERLAESVAGEMTSAAIDQPGSEVERAVAGGRLRITFEPADATATAELLPPTLGYRASEVIDFAKGLSRYLTDAETIQAIEAHPNVHDCTVRHADSDERFFAFRVKASDIDRAAGDRYKRTRYEFSGASMQGAAGLDRDPSVV